MENTNKIKIRKAKISDAQEIRLLENKVWEEEVTNAYDIPMFVRFGYVYVALAGNKIAGAIVGYRTNKQEIYICDLVVDEKYRGKKIGERLYLRLLQDTKKTNIISYIDPQNTASINLHKKLGARFSKVDNAYGLNEGMRYYVKILN